MYVYYTSGYEAIAYEQIRGKYAITSFHITFRFRENQI